MVEKKDGERRGTKGELGRWAGSLEVYLRGGGGRQQLSSEFLQEWIYREPLV